MDIRTNDMMADVPTLQDLLLGFISKYAALTEDEKNLVRSLDLFRSAKKGTILLSAGEQAQYVYLVLKGCIRTYYVIDGEEKTTNFYTELEGLTPHGVQQNIPSEYYISCVEDTLLAAADITMEAEILNQYPIFEKICRLFSEELVAKQQVHFDAFKLSSPETRYLSLMQNRPDLIQRVPQYQLASYLGITPQSLSRLKARYVEKNKHQGSFLTLSERV
ncbi:MAG: Crp/Fnr family transcriptional regulator [Bacteroidia bacterium]|nr:Crp/Fnr family transcriptional regulator [Bacteroidia bacterium]